MGLALLRDFLETASIQNFERTESNIAARGKTCNLKVSGIHDLFAGMRITHAILQSGKSDRGGWNAPQIAVLGVSWPLKKGWLSNLIGKEITAKDYERFLELRGVHKKQKIGAPKRPPKEHAELFAPCGFAASKALEADSPESFANELYEKHGRDLA